MNERTNERTNEKNEQTNKRMNELIHQAPGQLVKTYLSLAQSKNRKFTNRGSQFMRFLFKVR